MKHEAEAPFVIMGSIDLPRDFTERSVIERRQMRLPRGRVAPLDLLLDSALICKDVEEASERVSAVRLGFRADGDKEVS